VSTNLKDITDLKQDPENPNVGTRRGRQMIKDSLRRYGAGRSVVIDKKGVVLAGNKTLEQAIALGLEIEIAPDDGHKLLVRQRTDLDLDGKGEEADKARGLAYADNRTSEVGLDWDTSKVEADWQAGKLPEGLWTSHELEAWGFGLSDPDDPDDFDDLPPDLPGTQALKPVMYFESDEIYDIPPLLPDMLAELPQPLDVWAGQDASNLEWEGWWLYCYGSDSVRGLDLTRTIMAFYTDDYRFENWFLEPNKYVGRALNAGVQIMVAPNFSLWYGDPQAFHIFNIYRSRYLARYFQEAGIPVIPDANWASEESFGFCLAGIPKNAPCVSIQLQTMANDTERVRQKRGVVLTLEKLEPQSLLLYGGGVETRKNIASVLPDSLSVTWIESRSTRRGRSINKHRGGEANA